MTDLLNNPMGRRGFVAGTSATALVALSGCASFPGFGFTDAVRRLLVLSSERAFARLTSDGGFWDQQIDQVGLGNIMGTRGDILATVLTSGLFKSRLEGAFADLAVEGAERAAPIVAETIRIVGFEAAEQLVRGGPTAATSFLRGEMGNTLVEAMVPELGNAIRLANDPVIGQAINRLSGIDVAGVANRFSGEINNAIWTEMGIEEAAIRRNPRATNDPVIMGVFGLAGAVS